MGLYVRELCPRTLLFGICFQAHQQMQDKLNQILGFVGGFVEERRREMKLNRQLNKEKDFLDVLLEFEGNGKDEPDKISDRNLNILILELLTAGTEATMTTIEWAMTELLRNPETMKKVQAEIAEVVGHARKIEETDMAEKLGAVLKKTIPLRAIPKTFV